MQSKSKYAIYSNATVLYLHGFINTSKNRGTLEYIDNANKYIELINDDSRLKLLWTNYRNNYDYAKNIEFEDTINAIKNIIIILESESNRS